MSTDAVARSVERTVRAVRSVVTEAGQASPPALAARLLEVVGQALGADGGALVLMDPDTGLFTTGAVDRLPTPSCHPFFAGELDAGRRRAFRRLARDGAGASALSGWVDDDQSFRTTVLEPVGYDDELRVVCRDAGIAWAGMSLWRRRGSVPFSREHERALDAVADLIGAAVRDAVLRSLVSPGPSQAVHGALVIEDGAVVEAGSEVRSLLREIDEPTLEEYRPLDHLLALSRRDSRFSVVLGTRDGRWVTAHGTALSESRTAVVLTSPSPADLLGALVAGAGLTAREVEVTLLLCRGLSDAEIARELTISAHTAHDHVRSVRTKLGVRSRAEVASRVFADRYLDRFLATASVLHED